MTVNPLIQTRETILVTGGSGFIGMHCIAVLLKNDYKVKAVVRSDKKGSKLMKCFRNNPRLIYGIIEDITDYDSLVKEIKNCHGVLHLASPYTYAVDDFVNELLEPAINGTTTILKACLTEPMIKRVVITSSFAAVFDASKGPAPGTVYTELDFSPLTFEDGAKTKDPAVAYRASKIVAEMSAWNFIKTEKPSFDIAVICAPMVYGPLYSTGLLESKDDLNFSNAGIWKMSQLGKESKVPATKGPVYVDVRDLAEAHFNALIIKEASNERFIVSAGDFCNQEICDILRKNLPIELADKVPIGNPGERMTGTHFTTDSTKAIKILGITFRGIKESVVDLIVQLNE